MLMFKRQLWRRRRRMLMLIMTMMMGMGMFMIKIFFKYLLLQLIKYPLLLSILT